MAFQNIAGRLVDVIFGYDFFVSYTWADGSKYAHSLYEKLKAQGFTVFLDEEDYARGDNWTLLGRRALKKTRQLILVATPKVHESAPVLKELTAFQSTGRRIIPIEIGDSLNPQKYPESLLLPLIPAELLKIPQPLQNGKIPNEAPPEVIRELRRGFQHVRQAQFRVRVLLGTCLVLLGLLGIAIWQGYVARAQRDRARATLSQSDFLQALDSINEGKDYDGLAQLARSLSFDRDNQAAACRLITLLTYRQYANPLLRLKHDKTVYSAHFSPDGKRIVTALYDWTARIWDAQTGTPITKPMKHGGAVRAAHFSPDGKRIASSSGDTVRIWDAQTGTPITESMKHRDSVNSVQFSPDGKWIVTASADRTARIWDAQSGTPLTEPMKHGKSVYSAQFSPDGKRIVTASADATARIWDAQSGTPLTEPMKHDGPVSAQFSPDGKRIVTASWDGTVRIWDAQIGKPLTEPMKHSGKVWSAQFSPDGKRIVTASWDGTVRIWDAQTGNPLTEPMKHDRAVSSAQFSPDGKRIVTASWDTTARIWDARTGTPITEPMKHDDAVSSAQFSPDGKRIVTASWDTTVRIWDAQSGIPHTEPMKHGGAVSSAQFSPDGK